MKNLKLLIQLALIIAAPLLKAEERHQSYISFDDGGTIVRQLEDGRETEGRVNLPIYPGDEIVTSRRGRTEVMLADANVIGIDRSTASYNRTCFSKRSSGAGAAAREMAVASTRSPRRRGGSGGMR